MSSSNYDSQASEVIVDHLKEVFLDLSKAPYPHVENPPHCTKRASVALVVRIQPGHATWPPTSQSSCEVRDLETFETFFSSPWVQHGDPEVLFIKRAARAGDRWTSHVALPGGKRDPEDEDDKAAAVRETWEEVGLDLTGSNAIFVGNLPARVVTTSWGKVPLMVLCPFVFLLTRHDVPPLKLQPSEVGSSHWVPIRALLSPSLRSFERCDVSDRLARQGGSITRALLRAMLGQMLFAAVRLTPSQSVYCTTSPGFLPEEPTVANDTLFRSWRRRVQQWWLGDHAASPSHDRPLLLWGLTLGIMADFLELLPPYNALELWTYPTFTPADVRLAIWAMTHTFRKRKRKEVEEGKQRASVAVEHDQGPDSNPPIAESKHQESKVGIDGYGVGGRRGRARQDRFGARSSAVGVMLDGYYDLVRKAVAVALLTRLAVPTVLMILWVRMKRRH
ncbi:MAG: hypothetical protein M1833_006179 [Piccolia ochrophora]|nr:MAG: hypothetical protein M1833_006179 [Piccolia ochrophora]